MHKYMSRDDDFIRRMSEPEDLRELRRQAERLERERERQTKALLQDLERDQLRRKIRGFGEQPCR